jgi:hypothetical protein
LLLVALYILAGGLVVDTLDVATVRAVPAYGCCRAVLARLFWGVVVDRLLKDDLLNFPGDTLLSLRAAFVPFRMLLSRLVLLVTEFRHERM